MMHPIQSLVNLGYTEQELCPKNVLVRTDRYTERHGWMDKVKSNIPRKLNCGGIKTNKRNPNLTKKKGKQRNRAEMKVLWKGKQFVLHVFDHF